MSSEGMSEPAYDGKSLSDWIVTRRVARDPGVSLATGISLCIMQDAPQLAPLPHPSRISPASSGCPQSHHGSRAGNKPTRVY
ncbi:hypothetical protein SBV1_130034 [Verrucomicrobia bacterium]|nr:hypothetical protein SBV1_130034 [Verrucomicrobiota bacterium]